MSPVLALLVTTVLAGASTARADTEIAAPARGTFVDADVGVLVWSTYDPARRVFHLAARRDGRNELLAVESQRAPFDADVGTDAGGRPVVVYTRCGTATGSCDVRVFSFSDGRDRRVPRASLRGVDDFAATVWGGRVAWVRRPGGEEDAVLTGALAPSDASSRRLLSAARTRCGLDNLRRRRCERARTDVHDLELRGTTLARVARVSSAFSDDFEVRVGDLRRARTSTLVDSFSPGELSGKRYLGLSLDGPFLHFYTTCLGDPGGCRQRSGAFRHRLRTGRLELAADRRRLTGFTVDRGRTSVGDGADFPPGERVCDTDQGQQDKSTMGPCPVLWRDPVPPYRPFPR